MEFDKTQYEKLYEEEKHKVYVLTENLKELQEKYERETVERLSKRSVSSEID